MQQPKWTDFNRGDPGVTLLELVAFLTLGILFGSRLASRIRGHLPTDRDVRPGNVTVPD